MSKRGTSCGWAMFGCLGPVKERGNALLGLVLGWLGGSYNQQHHNRHPNQPPKYQIRKPQQNGERGKKYSNALTQHILDPLPRPSHDLQLHHARPKASRLDVAETVRDWEGAS